MSCLIFYHVLLSYPISFCPSLQIARINRDCGKVVARIESDQKAVVEAVETYTSALAERREALGERRSAARRLMSDGGRTDKIRHRKETTEQLEALINTQLEACKLEPYSIPPLSGGCSSWQHLSYLNY